MRTDASRAGAAAGALAVVLFVAGAVVIGGRPPFDAPAADFAAFVEERRTRIQVGVALNAAMAPLLVWFLATVVSVATPRGEGACRAANVVFGCGLVFVALFLADVTALAVGALRPERTAADPELAAALQDFEWLAMGVAAPAAVGLLGAAATLGLRETVWPRWVGWLAAAAAAAYALRIGTLFTTSGPFAADGALGLYVPVAAIAAWLIAASVTLAR